MMSDDQSSPDPESAELPAEDGVELSLDELGRAYARASGLIPDEPEADDAADAEPQDDDDAACELSPRSILEAILFVGSPDPEAPLTTQQIAKWIRGVDAREIGQLARDLQDEYQRTGSAFRVQRQGNHLRLVLAEEYGVLRECFYGEVRRARLSQPAIDVLAIVAYHQPVRRERVNELRGRDCGSILNQLVKRKLLFAETESGRSRVKLYRTTDRFLDLFGLESIEDLPESEDISLPG
jgi:segregation and condensation protein B